MVARRPMREDILYEILIAMQKLEYNFPKRVELAILRDQRESDCSKGCRGDKHKYVLQSEKC
jgi:hypothetical protein